MINTENTTEQRKNARGSSPPDVTSEQTPENQRGPAMGKAREERRWTIWKAAYKLRRMNTYLRILGSAIKGRS
jgi:hypothetical protein